MRRRCALFHGIPDDPWTAIYPATSNAYVCHWLQGVAEHTVVVAHSHVAMERHVADWHIFNPGSVGVPLDGEHSASFMILEGDQSGWQLQAHRRIRFDRKRLLAEFERQDFVACCGVTAQLVIEEFRTARLYLAPFIAWKQQHYPERADSFALLQEFLTLDNRDDYSPAPYRGLTPQLFRD